MAAKLRVKGYSEESALAAGIYRDGEKRRWQQRAVLDYPQAAALLSNKESSVGRKLHCGGARETVGDELFGEACRSSGGAQRGV